MPDRKCITRFAALLGTAGTMVVGFPTEAGANNFGSSGQDVEGDQIWIADSSIQEYSIWGSEPESFGNNAYFGIETTFEPTDLTVSRAADGTDQDVIIVPTTALPSSTIGVMLCRTDVASIYGTHHHRVCDRKKMLINTNIFYELSEAQKRYTFAHEFGHAVGLRHSNAGHGINENGTYTARTHPGGGTVMATPIPAAPSLGLHAHDTSHINVHY